MLPPLLELSSRFSLWFVPPSGPVVPGGILGMPWAAAAPLNEGVGVGELSC